MTDIQVPHPFYSILPIILMMMKMLNMTSSSKT